MIGMTAPPTQAAPGRAADSGTYSAVDVSCRMDSGAEDIAVNAYAETRRGRAQATVGVAVFPSGGTEWDAYGGDGGGIITRRSLEGSAVLLTNSEEEPQEVGTATVTARLSRSGTAHSKTVEGSTTTLLRLETLRVDGWLTLPDDRRLALDDCTATRMVVTWREHPLP